MAEPVRKWAHGETAAGLRQEISYSTILVLAMMSLACAGYSPHYWKYDMFTLLSYAY
jgi:hypothetical protein